MCAIVGSFDIDKLKELTKLNAYRGGHSHSIAGFDVQGKLLFLKRAMGPIHDSMFDVLWAPGRYIVSHQQAPTTEARDITAVHPAMDISGNVYLWHNGIIKADFVRHMQNVLNMDAQWDTALMAQWLATSHRLDEVDGSFASICYEQASSKLYAFRNNLSPLFVDDDMNVSSTRFDGSRELFCNRVWNMDIASKSFTPTDITFDTKDNFYVDLDEL